jgi:hypothetical protein
MEPRDPDGADNRPAAAPVRKPYEKPRLEVYGDLTEISKSLAAGTRNDGAGHPNKHFTS